MALSTQGADDIIAAAKKAQRVVFIGYMRRYALAFLRVKELVKSIPFDKIQYVRVRDLIGSNAFFVDQSGTFAQKFTDFPPEALAERRKLEDVIMGDALGPHAADPMNRRTWSLLGGLASHDLSSMRELLGMPKRVLSARRSADSLFIHVLFD